MPKNIVICCDGTSNAPTTARTNVLKLWLSLERDEQQLAYYDPGVGATADRSLVTGIGRRVGRMIDFAAGTGLRDNVLGAYRLLMRIWDDGDRIFLFGFSRGAYTVRALSGLMQVFGLAETAQDNLVEYMWHVYSNKGGTPSAFERRMRVAAELRQFNRRPRVHFLGAWDTVSSWGLYFNFASLPYTASCPRIDHIRHAVAIDERRSSFKQNLFNPVRNNDLQEVWFPGGHGDVGGGHPEEAAGLSKLALEWMLSEARGLGLRVRSTKHKKYLGRANRAGRTQYSTPDPCAPMHAGLRGLWWVLEYTPRLVWDGAMGRKGLAVNAGRRREFRPLGSAVHLSVGERFRAMGYAPHGIVDTGNDSLS
ncbi:MAG: DUF2235 domain-containing protein [Planctomycetota bacterium]